MSWLIEWLIRLFVGRSEPDPKRQENIDKRLQYLDIHAKVVQGGRRR